MEEPRKYRRGLRNNYRRSMPLPEAMAKDLRFIISDGLRWIRSLRLQSIVVYPDFPSKKTTLYKMAHQLGFRLTNKTVRSPRLVFYFEDITHGSSAELRKIYPEQDILNEHCTDISKKKVDRVHQQVFGYNTTIDPRSHSGKAVRKSDANALHDGVVVLCPVASVDEKAIYQVLIDNTHDAQYVMDYRVAVLGRKVVLVYKKFKKYEVRFTNDVSWSELHNTDSIFSSSEQECITRFAETMGADFCELDVLRDKTDGRIYVIDVNKTPYGPPSGLPTAQAKQAVQMLTSAFTSEFLS